MAKMMVNVEDDVFFTPVCGIYRWRPSMVTRPGTYLVVWLGEIFDAILFSGLQASDGSYTIHPTCVVDDFGQLVRVPS